MVFALKIPGVLVLGSTGVGQFSVLSDFSYGFSVLVENLAGFSVSDRSQCPLLMVSLLCRLFVGSFATSVNKSLWRVRTISFFCFAT